MTKTKNRLCPVLGFFLAAFFVFAGAACAEPAEVPSVFVVKGRNIGPYNSVSSSLKDTLQGRLHNIRITEFDFESDKEGSGIKGKISEGRPALVVTLGTPATKVLRKVSPDTPVVYTLILDPAKSGVTPPGVAMDIPSELKLKKLQKIIPAVKKIGAVYSPEYRATCEELKRSCNRLGLELVAKEVREQKDFPAALEEIFNQVDCFFMIADPNIYIAKTTEYLLLQGLQRKVPVVGLSSSYSKAGAFIAFDCDYEDLGKQTAVLALKVMNKDLQSIREAEFPQKAKLSINLLVAERLGIAVSADTRAEAAEVFGK